MGLRLQQWLQDGVLLFDGATGTMLQQRGLEPGRLPELLNLEAPDQITDIHRDYVRAGARVISANTFQAHALKLEGACVEQVVSAGIRCAREAGAELVALDVGPLGQLMEPMGVIRFEQAYEVYREQMVAGARAGADLILIETISDLYEAKAAVLAAREHTDLPVICSMTFQEDGRSFVGCDPLTAVMTLQGLGVDALGANCSTGPDRLLPLVETMLRYSRVPVIVQANAGIPAMGDGQPVYHIAPEEYAAYALQMAEMGVAILGGCCGTTPETIRLMKERLSGRKTVVREPLAVTACTSGTRTVILDGRITAIGERINPTGKKKMKAALLEENMDYLLGEAIAQAQAGAGVLDVNVGLPDTDEPRLLSRAVREIQGAVNVPLQIDSADPKAMEAALRVYNGKAIINSVNGKRESMERIFPLAKKYGALVVGLTLDEDGIPPTAAGRLEVARRIRDTAVSYGICPEDLIIDCLVLTVSAQQEQAAETLEAIRLVKRELGLKTALGVSNVSFGLPQRAMINATFLAAAIGAGLDAPILNPLEERYRQVLDVARVLNGEDENASVYVRAYADSAEQAPHRETAGEDLPLGEIIRQGRRELASAAVRRMLTVMEPLDIIDREFIPALNDVGSRFEGGRIFLPQLMMSAQTVQNGFAVIREHMNAAGMQRRARGKILLATVYGDIHDIGKNIVRMLLENYGYEALDLGKDVPVRQIVDTIREQDIRLAGLSALMTTTVKSMKETIEAVREAGLSCRFMVGGAVLSEEYAQYVGADYYVRDAMDSVAVAERFFGGDSEG